MDNVDNTDFLQALEKMWNPIQHLETVLNNAPAVNPTDANFYQEALTWIGYIHHQLDGFSLV